MMFVHAKSHQSCLTLCDPRLLCPWHFSGKNTGVGWHTPPGDLPDPGVEPTCLRSPALASGFFTISATRETCVSVSKHHWCTLQISRNLICQYVNKLKNNLKKKQHCRFTVSCKSSREVPRTHRLVTLIVNLTFCHVEEFDVGVVFESISISLNFFLLGCSCFMMY